MQPNAHLKIPLLDFAAASFDALIAELGGVAVEYGGESLILLPSRMVWWPAQRTLFIADLHFGKEATFRAAAIPVPDQTAELLQRLTRLVAATQAVRIIVLGDLIHARQGRCSATFRQIAEWRQANGNELDMLLVRGNHDLAAGDPPADWHIHCVADPGLLGPFVLNHIPAASGNATEPPTLAGHLHPVVRLHGPARDSLRLPCFLLRPHVLVLPAFSHFVDGKVQLIERGDRVFAVADERVVEVPVRVSGGRSVRVRR
ncbi:MAG: ligase-associated DNA damage response endonuclease PdeM [Planctomycetota bacterium]